MAPPNPPYVNIQTGFTDGTINANGQFYWWNSGGGNCTVSNVGSWCTQSTYGPMAGGQSMQATVSNVSTGSYSYSSPCQQTNQPVRVIGGHPTPLKKK